MYVEGYAARVEEALRETCPAVFHLIGHDASHGLAARYAAARPSSSYNLDHAGRELPTFLERDPLTDRFPFLPDLAALEWAVVRAFHARGLPAADRSRFAALTAGDWSGAMLEFQPSLALRRSKWPIATLWAARDTPIAEIDIVVADRSENVLVRRSGHDVACDTIGEAEADVLEALLSGVSLGELAATLAERAATSRERDHDYSGLSRWLVGWMQAGLVTGVEVPPRRGRPRP